LENKLDQSEQKSLKQIIDIRLEKINQLRHEGVEPYPYSFKKEFNINHVLLSERKLKDKSITVAGRIISLRSMGKACFMNVQDETGKIQLYIKNELIGIDLYNNIVKKLDIGDIIGVEGKLFRTRTDQLSINIANLTLLSKNIRPLPNIKEKDDHNYFAFEDKENRYRYRHLDLIVNPKNKDLFKSRSKIIYKIREILNDKGFMEVETPTLQNIHGGASAKPFVTHHNALGQDFYLRIAEELYLKRLLIGGFEKIYEIGKNFRNEGIDRTHNPEFTMLELYESYSDVSDMMVLCESLIKDVSKDMEIESVDFMGNKIELNKKFNKTTMSKLFKDKLNCDILSTSKSELFDLCKKNKLDVDKKMNFGQLFDKIFSVLIEPTLIQPTFVFDYPKSISPLAKVHRENDQLAERFELFIAGMEFANAFSELNDPIDQKARFEEQLDLLQSGDEEAHQMDIDFIESMEVGMPPTGGIGIGIDRLVMLLLGKDSIKDIILFPSLRNK
tara:strand:+ start:2621 stop:4123 length:1503 start_codon:yes stop_codon:yes gene_type:complete